MTGKETIGRTIKVTLILCLVCSILVSSVVVLLRPLQKRNVQLDIERVILKLTEISKNPYELSEKQVASLYKQITPKLVDLTTGKFIETTANGNDVSSYNQRAAAKDPKLSVALAQKQDIANIKREPLVAKVYVVYRNKKIDTIVLPISGYGLWSTMYGFIALESDLNTVRGMSFYEQGETPGLGGEVDNPKWKASWKGKEVYNNKGDVALHLVKIKNQNKQQHEIDALSGASMTSAGVSNLIKFWMSDSGFKPLLTHLKEKS
jgi:Na+-transporting NADH:ubiquinone oxidoreductase subunit C